MAYTYNGTGTGTEDDPYIPQSCEDLLYTLLLVNNVMKYIKLTMDFDFSSDPQFKNGITEPLGLRLVTCYGDNETNLRKIIGLRITSSCFFSAYGNLDSSGAGEYKNIFFKDCVFVHDQGSINTGLVYSRNYSPSLIENCNFSMFCKYTPSVTQALFTPNNLTVKNCCGYFVANDDLSNDAGAALGLSVLNNCINCSFILHNFSIRVSATESQAILSNSQFTSVVLSYPTAPPPKSGGFLLVLTYNCTDCSFAIYGNVKPKNSSGLCTNLTINNSQNVIFQNDDIYKDLGWNLTAPTALYNSSLIFRLTTEQMKDLDYLTQIGFTI